MNRRRKFLACVLPHLDKLPPKLVSAVRQAGTLYEFVQASNAVVYQLGRQGLEYPRRSAPRATDEQLRQWEAQCSLDGREVQSR